MALPTTITNSSIPGVVRLSWDSKALRPDRKTLWVRRAWHLALAGLSALFLGIALTRPSGLLLVLAPGAFVTMGMALHIAIGLQAPWVYSSLPVGLVLTRSSLVLWVDGSPTQVSLADIARVDAQGGVHLHSGDTLQVPLPPWGWRWVQRKITAEVARSGQPTEVPATLNRAVTASG